MNERYLFLLEKYLNKECSLEEETEFKALIENDSNLKTEYEEQKKVKEVLSKMMYKNPPKEIWDNYWLNIYNKVERGIAWIAISIGVLIILGFASYEMVFNFLNDNQTPALLKFGIAVLVFGFLILLYSIIRERVFLKKRDKYKEIIR